MERFHHSTEEAACKGKHRYTTPQQAHQVANRTPGTSHFRCGHCNGWHLAHRPKRPKAWRRPTGEIA